LTNKAALAAGPDVLQGSTMSRRRREIKKLLVIQLGPLGDFIQSLAAMKHIRDAHSAAEINLLTTAPFAALAQASPYVDAVAIDGRPDGLPEILALARRLRAARYDRVYDLQAIGLTNLYFQLLRPFSPAWSGTAFGCSLPVRHHGRSPASLLERQAGQLRDAGIWPDAPTEPGAAPPADVSWILNRAAYRGSVAASPRPYVLLAPGGGEARPENRWPAELYGKLAAILRGWGLDVLVIGGPEDSGLAHAIQRVSQARDLTGRADFAHTAVLAARATLAIGNHLDLLHLIAATGAPTLALLPKVCDPCAVGPRGHVAVLQAERLADLAVADVATTLERLLPAERKTV
jgi:ADP-heptose:LPS heptosyltransferase